MLVLLVSQDVYLFAGTVCDNLVLGRPEATDAEVERAARAVNAHEFVAALPQGYDTGARRARLATVGGERQRLAIARALLADAPVLVLDEATCSVDGHSEALIHQARERLRRGRTTIVVAHRLSTGTDLLDLGAVRENLLLGRPDAADADVERAVGAAQFAEVVAALLDRATTVVGERGARLSGGECQRLALARALVVEAPCSCSTRPPPSWTRSASEPSRRPWTRAAAAGRSSWSRTACRPS